MDRDPLKPQGEEFYLRPHLQGEQNGLSLYFSTCIGILRPITKLKRIILIHHTW